MAIDVRRDEFTGWVSMVIDGIEPGQRIVLTKFTQFPHLVGKSGLIGKLQIIDDRKGEGIQYEIPDVGAIPRIAKVVGGLPWLNFYAQQRAHAFLTNWGGEGR